MESLNKGHIGVSHFVNGKMNSEVCPLYSSRVYCSQRIFQWSQFTVH